VTDLSGVSTEELMRVAGVSGKSSTPAAPPGDPSSVSTEELMRAAGVQPERPRGFIAGANSAAVGMIDQVNAAVQNTSPIVAGLEGKENYRRAPDSEQWLYKEQGIVRDPNKYVALRDPQTNDLAVFERGEATDESRLTSLGRTIGAGAVTGPLLPLPEVLPTAGNALPAVGRTITQSDRWGKGPERAVDRKILQGMQRDNTTPGQVEARLRTLGPNATIADAAGENVTGLLETAANQPGTARQMANRVLMRRQKGAGDRITESSGRELGTGNFHQTIDDLNTTRKTTAAPLYEEAYAQPHVWSDTIDTLLDRPSGRKALGRAYRIAAEEGRDPSGLGLSLNEAGDVVIDKTKASMQTLDYVKRGIDDVVETFRDPVTGKLRLDESGRAINSTRADLVKELRSLNPKYGEALDAWAGPSKLMDAMQMGRRFHLPDSEVTEKIVAGMSQGEREAFLLGVQRNISDIVDKTGQTADAVRKLIGTPKMQKALQAAFPDTRSYRRFVADLLREGQFNRTKNTVLGNSATARRLASQDDLGVDPGPLIEAAQGNYASAGKGILRNLFDRSKNMPEKQRTEMAQKLLSTDPVKNLAALRQLTRKGNPGQMSLDQRQALATALMSDDPADLPADK
jgi:hypothetical protein